MIVVAFHTMGGCSCYVEDVVSGTTEFLRCETWRLCDWKGRVATQLPALGIPLSDVVWLVLGHVGPLISECIEWISSLDSAAAKIYRVDTTGCCLHSADELSSLSSSTCPAGEVIIGAAVLLRHNRCPVRPPSLRTTRHRALLQCDSSDEDFAEGCEKLCPANSTCVRGAPIKPPSDESRFDLVARSVGSTTPCFDGDAAVAAPVATTVFCGKRGRAVALARSAFSSATGQAVAEPTLGAVDAFTLRQLRRRRRGRNAVKNPEGDASGSTAAPAQHTDGFASIAAPLTPVNPLFKLVGLNAAGGLDPFVFAASTDSALQAVLAGEPQLHALLYPASSRDFDAAKWHRLNTAVAHEIEADLDAERDVADQSAVSAYAASRDLLLLVGSPRRLSRRMAKVMQSLRTGSTPSRRDRLLLEECAADPPVSDSVVSGNEYAALSATDSQGDKLEYAPPSCSAWRLASELPARVVGILDRLRRAYWATAVGTSNSGLSHAPVDLQSESSIGDPMTASGSSAVRDVMRAGESRGLLDPLRFFSHELPAALTMLAAIQLDELCSAIPTTPSRTTSTQESSMALRSPPTLSRSRRRETLGDTEENPVQVVEDLRVQPHAGDSQQVTASSSPSLRRLVEYTTRNDTVPWWPGCPDSVSLPEAIGTAHAQLGLCGAAALCKDFMTDVLLLSVTEPPEQVPSVSQMDDSVSVPAALRRTFLPKRRAKRSLNKTEEHSAVQEPQPQEVALISPAISVDVARVPLRVAILQVMLHMQLSAMCSCTRPVTSPALLPATLHVLIMSVTARVCFLGVQDRSHVSFLTSRNFDTSLQRAFLEYACTPFIARCPSLTECLYECAHVARDESAENAFVRSEAGRIRLAAALSARKIVSGGTLDDVISATATGISIDSVKLPHPRNIMSTAADSPSFSVPPAQLNLLSSSIKAASDLRPESDRVVLPLHKRVFGLAAAQASAALRRSPTVSSTVSSATGDSLGALTNSSAVFPMISSSAAASLNPRSEKKALDVSAGAPLVVDQLKRQQTAVRLSAMRSNPLVSTVVRVRVRPTKLRAGAIGASGAQTARSAFSGVSQSNSVPSIPSAGAQSLTSSFKT
jgi:hypothetical protein